MLFTLGTDDYQISIHDERPTLQGAHLQQLSIIAWMVLSLDLEEAKGVPEGTSSQLC